MNALPACGACGAGLPEALFNLPDYAPCPTCSAEQIVEVYPAFLHEPAPSAAAESIVAPGEAACFFHAGKRAVVSCARCGVFLCALCDLPIGVEHLCPRCLEAGVSGKKLQNLENHRFLYDQLAISLCALSLVVSCFAVLTAPAALFVSIRYWNAPRSIVRPGRARMVVALVLSILEILGGLALVALMIWGFASRGRR